MCCLLKKKHLLRYVFSNIWLTQMVKSKCCGKEEREGERDVLGISVRGKKDKAELWCLNRTKKSVARLCVFKLY